MVGKVKNYNFLIDIDDACKEMGDVENIFHVELNVSHRDIIMFKAPKRIRRGLQAWNFPGKTESFLFGFIGEGYGSLVFDGDNIDKECVSLPID